MAEFDHKVWLLSLFTFIYLALTSKVREKLVGEFKFVLVNNM